VEKVVDGDGDRLYLQALSRDLRVKRRQEVNSRLLHRCLQVEGMDVLIRALDPA
jgi:hypothetical protein